MYSVQEKLAAKQTEVNGLRQQVEQLTQERDAAQASLQTVDQQADMYNGAGDAPAADADEHMAEADEQHPGNGAVNPAQMTITEIKEWLTDRGHEGDVWNLANRKAPRAKKDDWVQLIASKQ